MRTKRQPAVSITPEERTICTIYVGSIPMLRVVEYVEATVKIPGRDVEGAFVLADTEALRSVYCGGDKANLVASVLGLLNTAVFTTAAAAGVVGRQAVYALTGLETKVL